ncbi:hypothetical protein [Candidatus Oleimmundimicrobium sp.]|uniref:hypothetical protein n=1 Tax=Candidatus Oleimmundimicrobium sp. TaxID=3060597 RepID=UPI00271E8E8F|nr:hypothetical protein [Candidatus Oleimmundimicrobium sp.]MDO8885966.1 hypothetical protein [Candidatus Oleimmundimicrobium sp.]
MIDNLVLSLIFKTTSKFLPFIAKRIYPESQFKNDVLIDVRSTNPISFSLSSNIPTGSIYLKIINKSPYLDAVLEKVEFSLWIGSDKGHQPLIKNYETFLREMVKRGDEKELYFCRELNCFQVDFLREIKESKEIIADLLGGQLYVNSSLYTTKKEVKLENKPCRIG